MQNDPVQITETESGIPVITERVPGASAGFLAAVRTGSRDEHEGIGGISHLLEHTVFRETRNMDSFEMAKVMEGAGGELNAFTGKEMTAFYGITLAETGDVAMRMVADIVSNPLLSEKDTELEKAIVLQELSMIKSEPESYIHDLFEQRLWDGDPLGWDEGGEEKVVEGLTFEDLRAYYAERYGRPNLAVFATGEFDRDAVSAWAEESFKGMEVAYRPSRKAPKMPGARYSVEANHTDHIQIALGFPTAAADQHERDTLSVLASVLGGGTSSRLFQQVREKNALVYSIYGTASSYSDAGYIVSMMSCTAKNVPKARDETISVIRDFLRNGLEKDELQRTKNMLKGAFSRSAETTDNRIYRLCRNYMTYGVARGTQATLDGISSVTEEDVMKAAEKYLRADGLNLTVLGKVGKKERDYDISSADL